MTVVVNDYRKTQPTPAAISIFIEGADDLTAFKQLIHNGANLYPNLPASMKKLVDQVTHGRVLQDYDSQK